jgi:hypothetical protein
MDEELEPTGAAAADDHGRMLSTTPAAAARYREAQRAAHTADLDGLVGALRSSLDVDPAFAVAASDLRGVGGEAAPGCAGRPMTTWERHHCEIVLAAAGGPTRAGLLLREHLAEVGCDPIALRIVADAVRQSGVPDAVDDLIEAVPSCHGGG